MGFIGICFAIGSVAIIIYIIIDVYLGAPQKPRTLLTVLITGILGGVLIFFDYYYKPESYYIIAYANRYQYVQNNKATVMNQPIKIKILRKIYPQFIVLRRSRMYADVIHLNKEVVEGEEFKIENKVEGMEN